MGALGLEQIDKCVRYDLREEKRAGESWGGQENPGEGRRIPGRICCLNINTGKSPFRSLHRLAPYDKYGDGFLPSWSGRCGLLRQGYGRLECQGRGPRFPLVGTNRVKDVCMHVFGNTHMGICIYVCGRDTNDTNIFKTASGNA